MAQMTQHGAVQLVHFFPRFVAGDVISFGNVDRDGAVQVAGGDELLENIRIAAVVFEKLEPERKLAPVNGSCREMSE